MLLAVLSLLASGFALCGQVVTGSFPKTLTQEEEAHYLRAYAEGNLDARNTLIEHNLRLVAHIVKKYNDKGDGDDLISIGTIGLIKGISSFNPEKNTRLATYAARCIENEILMSLRHDKKFTSDVSLQEPIGFDGEGNEVSLMEVLPSDSEDICEQIDQKNLIASVLKKVKDVLAGREKLIVQLRYGLQNGIPMTQREVASHLGISRSYVSRIEKKALDKLKV